MGGYGIFVTRLIAVAALVISVLGGTYLENRDGPDRAIAIVLLALVGASALMIRSAAIDPPFTMPRWAGISGVAIFTVAGGALCIAVPDGTATCLPFIAAWFAPRVFVSRTFEIGLLCVDVVALWAFCFRVDAAWWPYPVVVAGVIAAYQAGLRTRERAERTEFAELMLAREQALRSERERAAAATERERIARDLHDVLAHTLSGLAITLQNAAVLLRAGRADDAQSQVDRARALAVEGQGEARQALAALAPSTGTFPSRVDLAAAIDRTVRDHRALTGTAVTLRLDRLPELSGDVTSAVLAVLRESLTNVMRHAADSPVTVSVRAGEMGSAGSLGSPDGLLVLTVADEPGTPALPGGAGGMGLNGMATRIAAIGGTLRAGPTPKGWSVEVAVPMTDTASSTAHAGLRVTETTQR